MIRAGVNPVHFIKTGPGGDINLAADHRPDSLFFAFFIKVDHAVHHAVIGNRQPLLSQFLRPRHQRRDPASTVQQAVFRMYVQMSKVFHGKLLFPNAGAKPDFMR